MNLFKFKILKTFAKKHRTLNAGALELILRTNRLTLHSPLGVELEFESDGYVPTMKTKTGAFDVGFR